MSRIEHITSNVFKMPRSIGAMTQCSHKLHLDAILYVLGGGVMDWANDRHLDSVWERLKFLEDTVKSQAEKIEKLSAENERLRNQNHELQQILGRIKGQD